MFLHIKDVSDLISWKSLVSMQLDNLVRDNALLRSVSFTIYILSFTLLVYIWRVPDDFTALFGTRKILRKENRGENIEEKWKEKKWRKIKNRFNLIN